MTKPAAEGHLPQSGAGEAFQELVDIMARLRGPGGCPWDHEQTIESLRGFVLEETYEVLEAIDRRDHDGLKGEIGDLLFEGVFLAQIENDEGRFSVTDSLKHITAKLIRRHPHVFGDAAGVTTPGAVVEQWEQIKSREQEGKGEKKALLAGVPKAMPSLARANEISTRVAAVGFEWAQADGRPAQDRGGGRRAARGRAARDAGARRRRDGRPALLDVEPGAQDGDRRGVRAAQGEREVHEALHGARGGVRAARTKYPRRHARGDGGGVERGEERGLSSRATAAVTL